MGSGQPSEEAGSTHLCLPASLTPRGQPGTHLASRPHHVGPLGVRQPAEAQHGNRGNTDPRELTGWVGQMRRCMDEPDFISDSLIPLHALQQGVSQLQPTGQIHPAVCFLELKLYRGTATLFHINNIQDCFYTIMPEMSEQPYDL